MHHKQPVKAIDVAAAIGLRTVNWREVCRMLRRAAQAGLVQRIGRSGWIPVCNDSEKE
jgi:hypothetical protein